MSILELLKTHTKARLALGEACLSWSEVSQAWRVYQRRQPHDRTLIVTVDESEAVTELLRASIAIVSEWPRGEGADVAAR